MHMRDITGHTIVYIKPGHAEQNDKIKYFADEL